VLAGVCTARDGGTGAPHTEIMWGFTEQDLGARRRPSNPFEREPSAARVLRVDCIRSAGAAALRRPGDRLMHASPRHGLTHRGEDLPPPVATGLPTGCGCAVTAFRRSHLETALDIMRPDRVPVALVWFRPAFTLARLGPALRSHAPLTGVRTSDKDIASESGLVRGTVRLSGLVGGGYVGWPYSRAARAAV
jgi:hypothetical protein